MLTSLNNSTVKQIRKLQQSKERRRQNVLLLEGTHLVEAACLAGYPIQMICYTEAWQMRHKGVSEAAIAQADQEVLVSEAVLKSVASTISPDGVVAIAPRRSAWQAATSGPSAQVNLGILLEAIQDPGNLGTIIRTAAAAGSDGLWLSPDSVSVENPKVLRASVGQWFQLRMAVADVTLQAQQLRDRGVQIIATASTASLSYWELDLTQPTVFAMGNEGAGLSAALMSCASTTVKIPVAPQVDSLNVAISTALLLYEARRQRDT